MTQCTMAFGHGSLVRVGHHPNAHHTVPSTYVCSNGAADPDQLLSPLDRARQAIEADPIDASLMVSPTPEGGGLFSVGAMCVFVSAAEQPGTLVSAAACS